MYHAIRSFEFDIHNSKSAHGSLAGDWWTYSSGDLISEGRQHTAETLSDAFKEVQVFHQANPQHEVITFYINQHDDFETNRRPEDLDRLIEDFFKTDNESFAKSDVFTPGLLYESGHHVIFPVPGAHETCPAYRVGKLQAIVDGTFSTESNPACSWPLLSSLRGKIIFVVSGSAAHVDEYVANGTKWAQRYASTSYDHTYLNTLPYNSATNPYGFDQHPWEVFFNQSDANAHNVFTANCGVFPNDCNKTTQQIVLDKNFMGRSYGANSLGEWTAQRSLRVQLIGTDRVNDQAAFLAGGQNVGYYYAATHTPLGFPFDCSFRSGFDCATETEQHGSPILSVKVQLGDLIGHVYNESYIAVSTGNGAGSVWSNPDDVAEYSLHISAPGSWTEGWAKVSDGVGPVVQ